MNRAKFFEMLALAGFNHYDLDSPDREIVFYRQHTFNPDYIVKVYTGFSQVQQRGCGKDAIRVCAVYKDSGLCKLPRVYRTGKPMASDEDNQVALQERVLSRMRDAWRACNVDIRKRAGK